MGVARLQGCKVARLQDCKVARLQDCKVARLQGCKIARLQGCKTAAKATQRALDTPPLGAKIVERNERKI